MCPSHFWLAWPSTLLSPGENFVYLHLHLRQFWVGIKRRCEAFVSLGTRRNGKGNNLWLIKRHGCGPGDVSAAGGAEQGRAQGIVLPIPLPVQPPPG